MRRFRLVYKCFNFIKENAVRNYKLLALIYLLFFVFSQFTSPTTAVFNDTERINFTISMSNLEDKKEINNDVLEEEQYDRSDSKENESEERQKTESKEASDKSEEALEQSIEETDQTDEVRDQSTEVIGQTEEISEQTPNSENQNESSKSDEEEIKNEK